MTNPTPNLLTDEELTALKALAAIPARLRETAAGLLAESTEKEQWSWRGRRYDAAKEHSDEAAVYRWLVNWLDETLAKADPGGEAAREAHVERLTEHAYDEHEQGMKEAAAFVRGRAAASEHQIVSAALLQVSTELERMAKEQRDGIRRLAAGETAAAS